jgi:hypothetical protein
MDLCRRPVSVYSAGGQDPHLLIRLARVLLVVVFLFLFLQLNNVFVLVWARLYVGSSVGFHRNWFGLQQKLKM